ncbi:MAG: hypothetical protein N4A74_16415 [Carboxylicivirga sp.]|jgi:hypothetical protein|nr:hypothetical protein [Carboxylicivirga sp.]
MKELTFRIIVVIFLLIMIAGCNIQSPDNNASTAKYSELNTDSWRSIEISERFCKKNHIPVVPFSLKIPSDYEIELNPKGIGAIRFYKMRNDSILHEISIATLEFLEEFDASKEEEWVDEFRQREDIKSNKDLSIDILMDRPVDATSCYLMLLNNESMKYPLNKPLNTVGFLYISDQKYTGLVVGISKYEIDREQVLSDMEFTFLNTIKL